MENSPESFVKRYKENHLVGKAIEYKMEKKQLADEAYQRMGLPKEEFKEVIQEEVANMDVEELQELNSAVVNGWILVEMLLKLVNDKEEELSKISLKEHKN